MTNEQMAIVKARAIVIKTQEAVKVLEELPEKSNQMLTWWNDSIIHFNQEQSKEYLGLYEKTKELDKKLKELTE
ncbi:hypothetical protein [Lactococcus phage PLgY-30]|uniref:Uncharacterized protein n=2 Tax=Uwajimavirus PLgW1 TaxID=2845441 RepID=A0A2Z2P450_9CAUD|nr:hypothetical protein [Lactococcus phage PLgY-16]ASJ80066.1 hypothetical protein [Lactococcus phage PLgY-30]